MTQTRADLAATLYLLPPDAKFLPVAELSPRLRARIGPVGDGRSVITRPGLRVTARLVPAPFADLISEFHVPSLLTDAILRFATSHEQDPFVMLDLAFDSLATLIESRILVPHESADAAGPVPTLGAGQRFASFEVEAIVRSLDDSEVYRARSRSGAALALKVARDDRPAVAALLAHEATMLDRLGGVDTPRLIDRGTERGRGYLASEWCDGVSVAVAAQQARAARDRRRLHRLVVRMLEAYGRLHARGVLHGDVHPGNCLVRDDGRLVLLDLGQARAVEDGGTAVDPSRAGIPHFHDPQMAAALLAGQLPPVATVASEQYSIAALAYLLLTGLNHVEAPAIQIELLRRIAERRPLPFAARGVAAWPSVEAVLDRGLSERPEDRFPDVAALAHAFASAEVQPTLPPRWPDVGRRVFGAAVEEIRSLAPSSEPTPARAWFALRSALALEDAELLAAADILAEQAGPGWLAQAVVAQVARARSDGHAEAKAIARFLVAAEPLPDGVTAVTAVQAAAAILDDGESRRAEAEALSVWAARRLKRLLRRRARTEAGTSIPERPLAYAALSLARAGVISVPAGLPRRLEALSGTSTGDVWLWALAADVFADDRFKSLALAAPLPRAHLWRGLALLRLHQLTGDTRWVADAVRIVTRTPNGCLAARSAALLVAELSMPERMRMPPPWIPAAWHPRSGDGEAVPG